MLILKKEQHKASFAGRVKLFMHLIICDFCKAFAKQSKFINLNAPHTHTHKEMHVSEEFRNRLMHSLKES
jgi:hypothetical protein